jgi:hypothetical protein
MRIGNLLFSSRSLNYVQQTVEYDVMFSMFNIETLALKSYLTGFKRLALRI